MCEGQKSTNIDENIYKLSFKETWTTSTTNNLRFLHKSVISGCLYLFRLLTVCKCKYFHVTLLFYTKTKTNVYLSLFRLCVRMGLIRCGSCSGLTGLRHHWWVITYSSHGPDRTFWGSDVWVYQKSDWSNDPYILINSSGSVSTCPLGFGRIVQI